MCDVANPLKYQLYEVGMGIALFSGGVADANGDREKGHACCQPRRLGSFFFNTALKKTDLSIGA